MLGQQGKPKIAAPDDSASEQTIKKPLRGERFFYWVEGGKRMVFFEYSTRSGFDCGSDGGISVPCKEGGFVDVGVHLFDVAQIQIMVACLVVFL